MQGIKAPDSQPEEPRGVRAGLDFVSIAVTDDEAGKDEEEVHHQVPVPHQAELVDGREPADVKQDDHQRGDATQRLERSKVLGFPRRGGRGRRGWCAHGEIGGRAATEVACIGLAVCPNHARAAVGKVRLRGGGTTPFRVR